MKEYLSSSQSDTERIGARLARELKPGVSLVALYGELGAGKTAFVRGFVSVLSEGSTVKSPTYTIVNEYVAGPVPVFHFDFYRLTGPDDVYGMGFYEYLERGICISEWSERLDGELPEGTVKVTISKRGESSRIITVDFLDNGDGNDSTRN